MKSYYLINEKTDLLDSYDLSEMQMYILILKYLLRMGKKPGVTPAEDWEKAKSLLMRVKNHISFHTYGVKPSEITIDYFSPEVRKLFLAVFGNGSETYTKDWLDAFESVKDAIDSQVDDNRPMCQYGAASGKRCDNCQCPDPLSEPEYPTEKMKEWLAKFDEIDTAPEVDTEKPRFVVDSFSELYVFARYRITDTHTKIEHLHTASQETAETIAELLNLTIPGGKL